LATHAVQLDAVQEQVQVGGANLDTRVVASGKAKGARFETLEAGITVPSY